MNVLAIAGKAGTGKTTLANILMEAVPGSMKVSFAEPLKQEVADLLGLSPEYVNSAAFKVAGHHIGQRFLTGRQVLQWWGSEIRRAAQPTYWDDRMVDYLDTLALTSLPLVIVDDLRFPSEVTVLGAYDTAIVRLEPYEGWEPGPHADHLSETSLDHVNFAHTFRPEFGGLQVVADKLLEYLRA